MVSLLWLGVLAACGGSSGAPEDPVAGRDTGADPGESVDPGPSPCSPTANLEVVPLDPWGRDMSTITLRWDAVPTIVEDGAPGVVRIPFGEAAVVLRAAASDPELSPATLEIRYDGAGGFELDSRGGVGIARSVETRTIEGTSCPVTSVYLLLDHPWFAAQGRAPSNNVVEIRADGETHWEAVAADLAAVEQRVTWSTWWWDSAFELRREGDARTRAQSSVMGLFRRLPGAQRRVLINRFWDDNADWNAYLNTDPELRDAAERADDGFEVILQGNDTPVPFDEEYVGEAAPIDIVARVQANPRYAGRDVEGPQARAATAFTLEAASWHQKAMVFDGRVAWVTGMNTKQSDWDTSEHLVFDPRRMDPDADSADRDDVLAELSLPDNEPRKDYGVRLEGPAARDVEDVLLQRWDAGLAGGDLYADRATPFSLDAAPSSPPGSVPVQVVATMPSPWSDMSILETHAKAVAQAREYIFIEDQYFRSPRMNAHLVAAMDANPELVLIVVTQPVSTTDGGAKYTYLADATFRSLYPERYLLLQLKAAELTTEEGWWSDTVEVVAENIFVHSKLRLVDDRYLSVGSCNMNNRGYLYEGELNVVVLDDATTRGVRRDVFANLVGPDWEGMLSDDPRNNLDVFAMAAASNADILASWDADGADLSAAEAEASWPRYRPSGFVYPLQIESDYVFDVGPDAF